MNLKLENRKLPEKPYKEKKEYSYGYASILYLMSLVVTILSLVLIIMKIILVKRSEYRRV